MPFHIPHPPLSLPLFLSLPFNLSLSPSIHVSLYRCESARGYFHTSGNAASTSESESGGEKRKSFLDDWPQHVQQFPWRRLRSAPSSAGDDGGRSGGRTSSAESRFVPELQRVQRSARDSTTSRSNAQFTRLSDAQEKLPESVFFLFFFRQKLSGAGVFTVASQRER